MAPRDKLSLVKMHKKTHHAAMESERTIYLGEQEMTVMLARRKGTRRITLRYNPRKKQFRMTLPPRCSDRKVDSFLEAQKLWMKTTLTNHCNSIPLVFGNSIPVFGQDRTITQSFENESDLVVLATESQCEKVTTTTLKHMLHDYIDHKAQHYAALLNVNIERITIRDTSSRWGSCTIDGKLNFSWRLIFAPQEVLDYVIAHEVSHLVEMNHSAAFWSVVEGISPAYKTHRKWLRQNGEHLFRYGS